MLSLRREFNKKLDQIQAVGVGDSLNDLPMLSVVDAPFLAKKPGGWWEKIRFTQYEAD